MGSVEIVLGQRTMWRILFLIFITFFFLFMLMFFYKSDVSGLEPVGNHHGFDAPPVQQHGRGEGLMSQQVNCESLKSFKECSQHSDQCTVIEGEVCAAPGTTDKETLFGYCVSNVVATTYATVKMKMEPKIPTWMSSHPDYSAVCARPANSLGPLARFQSLIPPGWVQEKCVGCCVPPEPVPQKEDDSLALIVSVYNEYLSLESSMKSWKANGLLEYVQETYLYIDGGDPEIREKIESVGKAFGFTVMNEETNLGLGKALANLMRAVKSRFVLFLEKDWKLVEPRQTVIEQLDLAKRMLFDKHNGSRADVVKFRSRLNHGHPNIHPSKTDPPQWDDDAGVNMWLTQPGWEPHLFCNGYHYKKDDFLLSNYPHRMWKCGCDYSYWCFDAGQCGWTNNPIMYNRQWWTDTFYEISQKDWNRIFEAGTYYSTEWLLPHWVVAEGDGLFRHEEVGEGDTREFY